MILQEQLLGFERLGQVIIRPGLQPGDAVVRIPLGGQQQDRRGDFFAAQTAGQVNTVFARHHHIHHDQVELQPRQDAPRMGRIPRDRHEEPIARKEFPQEPADTFIVINDQKVGGWIAHDFASLIL